MFNSDEAERSKAQGQDVILVRVETSPEDIHGMHAATGILTTRGGMTSHAAVVARGMGRPCVSGAGALRIDYKAETMTIGDEVFRKGDVITVDGTTGEVLRGAIAMRQPELSGDFATLMAWADQGAPTGCAGECGYAAGCGAGDRVRRGRHRAVPDGAHVLR